jgi:hypothetical protein
MSEGEQENGAGHDDEPTESERRLGARHLTVYPIHLRKDAGAAQLVLIYDMSVSGARLLTATKLDVGSAVVLNLDISGEPKRARMTSARVVRTETRSPDCSDVWPFSHAVHFDHPLDDLEAEIKELAKQAAKAAKS